MVTQVIGKDITMAGVILLVMLKFIVMWQPVSLAQNLKEVTAPNLKRVDAQDLRLANLRPWDNPPVWSPDGEWVMGHSLREGLYIQTAVDGADKKQLGSAGIPRREISWSWDSEKLFYQVNLPTEDLPFTKRWIESVDIQTGSVKRHSELSIYDDLDSVAKSRYPNDPILFFNFKDNVIGARTKDGSQHWQVTDSPLQHLSIFLSPDKKKVLVDSYVYATDGSGRLFDLGEGFFGSWSPDSTKVLYTIEDDDGHTITASDLYVINVDGTGKKRLTHTPDELKSDPRWSPDGTKVAFYSTLLPSGSSGSLGYNKMARTVYIADILVETE